MKKIEFICIFVLLSLRIMAQGSDYPIGLDYYNKGDYKNAYTYFLRAANGGDMNAQNFIGNMYLNGQGVSKNLKEAFDWFYKSAVQGQMYAQANLGYMYDTGQGVNQDYRQAEEWYRKSAEQGYFYAQCCLGDIYGFGKGMSQDFPKALKWYRKAAEQGYAVAQCRLGELYDGGYGVKQNYETALDWHTKSAHQGNAYSQGKLGYYYLFGIGTERNYQEAQEWLTKAIETDNTYPYPYSNLALLYAQRDKNYSEALRYSDLALARMTNFPSETQALFYGERGQVYVWQGDMENAEKTLAKCLELNPDYLKGDDEFSKMMLSYHSNDVDSKIITNPSINKNTFAIIIGNEKYKNEVDVPFANNDAKIFGEYVEKTLGVPHDHIRFIDNAGYNDLRIAINWLTQAMTVCRGSGKAIVYYAGHGIPNESDLSAYLLPVDGIGNDPGSAYSLKDLYEKLGSVEAQSITIFLDACFSGSKREDGMLASARGVALKAKQSAPKGNMIVFSAAQGDETAYPYKEKKHGMFTYFLLKKLQETKGEVTLGELSDYLVKEVGKESFVKNGKMQTPTTNPSISFQNSWRNQKLK